VAYGYALNDPTSRQAAASMANGGWQVTVFQSPSSGIETECPAGVTVYEWPLPNLPLIAGAAYRLARWRLFRRELRRWIKQNQPELVVTIMLHPLAALPEDFKNPRARILACIYDIPSAKDAGHLDSIIFRKAWKRLREANVVWSSDIYKAQLTKQIGGLPYLPLVCHNCPPRDYMTGPTWPRDGWLRSQLSKAGASINELGGCIVLRAGAIGESCGIEETLSAMLDLPENVVFLMMGRPLPNYREGLLQKIESLGLRRRAFLWDRPSDQDWKRALRGADIGHMIHGPFTPGYMTRLYELNSSLSNYRLFHYMAAGLPIIAYDDPRLEWLYDEVPCFRIVRLGNLKSDIQNVLSELSQRPALREALGSAGRNAHISKYHWEWQFHEVLKSLAAAETSTASF